MNRAARRLSHALVAACITLATVAPARAQPAAPGAAGPGVTFGLTWNASAFVDARGGARTGTTATSNLNANAAADLEALRGWSATTAYADVLWVQGGQPSALAGDAQGVSNTAAPNVLKLFEAWLERNFADNRFSALVGLYDLSSEFYRLQGAGLFLNSSFGTGPEFAQSGIAGPSIFPNTSVGARLATKPSTNVVVRLAVLDAVPLHPADGSEAPGDGTLWVAEAAWIDRPVAPNRTPKPSMRIGRRAGLGEYTAKVALGAWHYTATFTDLAQTTPLGGPPLRHHGSSGGYAIAESALWSRGDGARVHGFVQLGAGDPRFDRFSSYVGAGIAASGLIAGRAADELGFAAAVARNGSHYLAAQHAQG
ncbi:MAG: carbohydrate porin, partial [Rhizobacter sp.]|nr:carbohydrate porin [Rhizobacter sp.]